MKERKGIRWIDREMGGYMGNRRRKGGGICGGKDGRKKGNKQGRRGNNLLEQHGF